jgi:hypothetical protein
VDYTLPVLKSKLAIIANFTMSLILKNKSRRHSTDKKKVLRKKLLKSFTKFFTRG